MNNFFSSIWVNFVNNLRIISIKTCLQTSTVLTWLNYYLRTWCLQLLNINFLSSFYPRHNPHLLEHKNSLKNYLSLLSTKTNIMTIIFN